MTHSILAHEKAPLFSPGGPAASSPLSALSLLQTGVSPSEASSLLSPDNLRQACYVSLHFFLKIVAAVTGPYHLTNDTLHLDMCNFRQSDACMADGARAGAFIPRGHSKSTFFTHGAVLWEIIRNPDIRICIVNNVESVARDFMRVVKQQFENNGILRALWPELCPLHPKSQARWNENEIVSPGRSRDMKEPTVMPLGVGAAAEGAHFDLIVVDDPDGLDAVDSAYVANANMEQTKKWFQTNTSALLDSWKTSRIIFVGTRYAPNDTASLVANDCRKVVGYKDNDIEVKPDGTWTVYYRAAIENGEVIYPEKFTMEMYNKLASNPDTMWTWMTQYMNSPTRSGLTEFSQLEVKTCRLVYSYEDNDYMIIVDEDDKVFLRYCDVVMTVDPAATEKGADAKTSRSSVGISAMDWQGRVFRIWSKVGFFRIDELYDAIFLGHQMFRGRVRCTVFEANAFQKVLGPLLRMEERTRGVYIAPIGKPVSTDKVARIRSTLGSYLTRGLLYTTVDAGRELLTELRAFPMGKRMDVLDEQEKACTSLSRPDKPQYIDEAELENEMSEFTAVGPVGY